MMNGLHGELILWPPSLAQGKVSHPQPAAATIPLPLGQEKLPDLSHTKSEHLKQVSKVEASIKNSESNRKQKEKVGQVAPPTGLDRVASAASTSTNADLQEKIPNQQEHQKLSKKQQQKLKKEQQKQESLQRGTLLSSGLMNDYDPMDIDEPVKKKNKKDKHTAKLDHGKASTYDLISDMEID